MLLIMSKSNKLYVYILYACIVFTLIVCVHTIGLNHVHYGDSF
jgi:hypothetical protein